MRPRGRRQSQDKKQEENISPKLRKISLGTGEERMRITTSYMTNYETRMLLLFWATDLRN